MKCIFCGERIPDATGKIVVDKTGKVMPFCSSKCEKNQIKLGRKALNVRWTSRAREEKASTGRIAKRDKTEDKPAEE